MSKIYILDSKGNNSTNIPLLPNDLVLSNISQAKIASWDKKISPDQLNITVDTINGKISSINRDLETLKSTDKATTTDITNIKKKLNDLNALLGNIKDTSDANNNYLGNLAEEIAKVNEFINSGYTDEIIKINKRLDNKADSYVQEAMPHSEHRNVSESDNYNVWIGDIWRKPSTGADYKYVRESNTDGTYSYYWQTQSGSIPDSLFDMIDGKSSIYFSKPSSYNKRDCWILESDEVHPPNKMGTLLFANKSNTTYNANDWVDLARYVTESDYNLYVKKVNEFIDKTYTDEIKDINNKIDSKADSYFQESQPHPEYDKVAENKEYDGWLGDIWRKPSTGADYKYVKTQYSDGTYKYFWELQTTSIPDDLFDKIDGKASIFFSKPTSYNAHDCWILESDTVHSPQKKGTLLFAKNSNSSYVASDWVDLLTYITQDQYQELQDRLNNFINETYTDEVKNINNKIDNKADSFVQEDKPHREYTNVSQSSTYDGWIGDIWRKISTGEDFKYVRVQGTSSGTYTYRWEAQSMAIPDSLYDKIDGKASIYFSKPSSYNAHDCWILENDTVHSPNPKGTLLFAQNSNTTYKFSDWVSLLEYITQGDLDDSIGDVTTKYQELSDRFSWLVSSSSSSSSLIITDKLIQAIATSNIQLSAKKILINGLLEGAGWRVDEEGNLEVNDLNIIGTLTCKNFSTENLVGSTIGRVLDSDKEYHATSSNLVSDILDDLPLNLNGCKVYIYMNSDITDDITLKRHVNGFIKIFLCGHTLTGSIHSTFNNAIYEIYGGDSEDSTIKGKIMPYSGYALNSYVYTIFCSYSPNVYLKNLIIYGDKANSTKNVGVGASQKTDMIISGVSFIGCRNICRSSSLARVHSNGSTGKSTSVGWYAGTGSRISFDETTQAGGSDNTGTGNNGQILSTGVTFCTSADSGSNNSTGGTTTSNTITCYPKYSDTYRTTAYNSWKKDGVARQGRWTKNGAESGSCDGYFFFDNQFAKIKGAEIKKVELTLSRKSGVGASASCSHGIYYHTYAERTSSAPTMKSCSTSISLGWDDTATATITNSDVLTGIGNGTIKGFAIKSSYDASHYSAISTCKVKIYYVGDID